MDQAHPATAPAGQVLTGAPVEGPTDEQNMGDLIMLYFKVKPCPNLCPHDWKQCSFMHPGENARRRDLRQFNYGSFPCPDYRLGFCIRGDGCPYAHGLYESWLHPSRYRTQLCKEGLNCRRDVCFFAHSTSELRTPTPTLAPTTDDVLGVSSLQPPRNLQTSAMMPANQQPSEVPPPPSTSPQVNIPSIPVSSGMQSNTTPQTTSDQPGQSSDSISTTTTQPSAQARDGLSDSASVPLINKLATFGSQPQANLPPVVSSQIGGMLGMLAEGQIPTHPPRMSKTFARKHGLNTNDSGLVTLLKLACAEKEKAQQQQFYSVPRHPLQALPANQHAPGHPQGQLAFSKFPENQQQFNQYQPRQPFQVLSGNQQLQLSQHIQGFSSQPMYPMTENHGHFLPPMGPHHVPDSQVSVGSSVQASWSQ